jgi:hypothetical protein
VFGSGGSDITSKINVIPGDTSGLRVYDRAQKEVDDLTRSTKAATGAADKLGDSLSKAAKGVDFGRTGGALERVVGGIGGNNELLGLGGDIEDLISSLTGDPAGLKGALQSLITPAGAITIGLAAVGLAFEALSRVMQEAERELQNRIDDYRDKLKIELNAEIEARTALLEGGSEALSELRNKAQQRLDILRQATTDFSSILSDMTIPEETRGAYAAALEEASVEMEALTERVEQFDFVLNSQAAASDRAFEAVKGLVIGGINFLSEKTTEAETALGDLGDELERGAKEFEKVSDAAEKAFTDLQTSVQSAVDKLDADGSKLGADLQKSITTLNARAIAANADAAEEIADLQIEAANDRLEAESAFYKETNRAFEDFRAEQLRIRQDADRAERDAVEANDILALLDIREQEQVDKQRNRERFETERQRRKEDFADRQQAETAALELTIASINARRDEEIASINAEIVAERAAFDASIAEINRLKDANIAQIEAVVAANERKHAAEIAAVDTLTRKYEALVLYQNGKLYQLNPGLMNSPAAPGLLPIPPAPDPFGLGQFFNGSALPPPRESSQSVGPSATPASSTPTVVFNEGAIVVGDIASKEDVKAAIIEGVIKPMAQARGVAA